LRWKPEHSTQKRFLGVATGAVALGPAPQRAPLLWPASARPVRYESKTCEVNDNWWKNALLLIYVNYEALINDFAGSEPRKVDI